MRTGCHGKTLNVTLREFCTHLTACLISFQEALFIYLFIFALFPELRVYSTKKDKSMLTKQLLINPKYMKTLGGDIHVEPPAALLEVNAKCF